MVNLAIKSEPQEQAERHVMRVKVGREYDSKDEGDDENKTAEYVAEESEGGSNANDLET